MKKIMLLGSGELGKEFTIAAKRAGQYVIACVFFKRIHCISKSSDSGEYYLIGI